MKIWQKFLLILILIIYNSFLLVSYRNKEPDLTKRYIIFNDSTSLDEKDFMLQADFWTEYSAGITTNIYIANENSSIQIKTYIDRHKSFFKPIAYGDKKLLNHELYHVKLTEVIAHELNNRIKLYGFDIKTTQSNIPVFKRKLDRLQNKYDIETDHSLNRPLQLYWEYKIDSMLSQNVSYEIFDEVKGYFPKKPTPHNYIYKEDTFSGKRFSGLDIVFAFWKIYEIKSDSTAIEYWLVNRLADQKNDDILIHWTQNYSKSFLEGYAKDTLNNLNIKEVLFKDENNLLYVGRYTYPLDHSEDSIFVKKGDLFFNSIKIDSEQPF